MACLVGCKKVIADKNWCVLNETLYVKDRKATVVQRDFWSFFLYQISRVKKVTSPRQQSTYLISKGYLWGLHHLFDVNLLSNVATFVWEIFFAERDQAVVCTACFSFLPGYFWLLLFWTREKVIACAEKGRGGVKNVLFKAWTQKFGMTAKNVFDLSAGNFCFTHLRTLLVCLPPEILAVYRRKKNVFLLLFALEADLRLLYLTLLCLLFVRRKIHSST